MSKVRNRINRICGKSLQTEEPQELYAVSSMAHLGDASWMGNAPASEIQCFRTNAILARVKERHVCFRLFTTSYPVQ